MRRRSVDEVVVAQDRRGLALGALAPLELGADCHGRGDGREGDRLEGAGTGLVGVLERGIAASREGLGFLDHGLSSSPPVTSSTPRGTCRAIATVAWPQWGSEVTIAWRLSLMGR